MLAGGCATVSVGAAVKVTSTKAEVVIGARIMSVEYCFFDAGDREGRGLAADLEYGLVI